MINLIVIVLFLIVPYYINLPTAATSSVGTNEYPIEPVLKIANTLPPPSVKEIIVDIGMFCPFI